MKKSDFKKDEFEDKNSIKKTDSENYREDVTEFERKEFDVDSKTFRTSVETEKEDPIKDK